jgi:antitoxin HicB
MKYTYPAVFHKEEGALWCEFPDLPGCQTFGDTITETMENAQEALAGYLLTLIDEKKDFARPSDITQIKTDKDSFTSLVICTIPEKVKSVKKTLTIPAWLNAKAEAAGINYSQLLQEAIKQNIGIA